VSPVFPNLLANIIFRAATRIEMTEHGEFGKIDVDHGLAALD
jgi:hypothetical protein